MSPSSVLARTAAAVLAGVLLTTCSENQAPKSPLEAPAPNFATSSGPVTLVGAGDIADCTRNGDSLTANLLDTIPGTVFLAGDNAYPSGSSTDYANCYGPTWGRHKARTRPAPGNHEYSTSGATGYFGYFGTAAGDPTKGYYSYELGDWHIIVLNGYHVAHDVGSAQEQWLKADLAASTKLCTLAYLHAPLFSSGTLADATTQILWQDLYAAGAEIVLAGHEHNYQRFAPQTPTGAADPANGIREFIVGMGGAGHFTMGTPLANTQVQDDQTYGVLKLTLYSTSYDWKFIPVAGKTFTDAGSTACHGASGSGPAASASLSTLGASPTSLTAGSGSSTISVTVRDAGGNPISGATVLLAATGSGNTVTQPSGTTNASGVASGALSSTVAETKTVSAMANGTLITQVATVTVKPGPVSASQSSVGASPASIQVATGTATLAVTAKDANGNPLSGATVALLATGGGNTLTQPSGTTNASGVAAGTLSSSVAESKTVSATANGTPITQTATVTVTASVATAVLVGAGQVARCDYANDEATALLLDNIPGTVFTTGDNVRASGSYSDFTSCYGPSWGRHKARTRPSVGDLDYQTAGASGYFDYFSGAAGDRDKGYYSYELGAWHIVVLNTNIDMTVGSPQELWLRANLAATGARCTLAYWHHPRFSSYGTSVRSSVKPLWDDLYAGRAEVVLNGHYRLYERFAPQTSDQIADLQNGIRQFTVGTGGHGTDSFGTPIANSEVRISGTYGVLRLTLSDGSYSWQFVPVAGQTATDSGSGTCH